MENKEKAKWLILIAGAAFVLGIFLFVVRLGDPIPHTNWPAIAFCVVGALGLLRAGLYNRN